MTRSANRAQVERAFGASVGPLAAHVPTDHLQAIAWVGALRYAIKDTDIVAAFREDTGNKWTPGRSGLDRMIDKATGVDAAFIEAFAAWFNANIWGPIA